MEFQLNYFKSQKMMLLKCCTQYVSKFGKLISDDSFYSNPKEGQCQRMFKQPRIVLISHAKHVRLCSKSFQLGINSTWTENLQVYKLGFEEAEEPEIKLPTFAVSRRKQRNSRKTSTSASLSMQKPLTVWITTNCGKFLKRWEYQTTCPPRNLYVG